MKKILLLSFLAITNIGFVFGQLQTKLIAPAPAQFTKAELLAFTDVKQLLTSINKKDYSNNLIRNFNLTTTITNPDKTTTKLSESGPGGTWSEKQKAMIEKYAKKGTAFTLENFTIIEKGKKGLVAEPNVSFSIKE